MTITVHGTHTHVKSRGMSAMLPGDPGGVAEHPLAEDLRLRPERCTLLGGTFALLVQAALAVTALGTLVYKRSKEKPRRPWLIWFFDASKQGYAGSLQHVVNLWFGVYFARSGEASECAWYLVNFTISVACGVVILWAVMRLYNWSVERWQLTLLRSGEYGSPPSWRPWLAQMLIWGFVASGEKVLTAIFVIVPLHDSLDVVASRLEAPLAAHPATELLLVMVVAPVILNAAFFWAIDNLIMRRRKVRPYAPTLRRSSAERAPHTSAQGMAGLARIAHRCASIPQGDSRAPEGGAIDDPSDADFGDTSRLPLLGGSDEHSEELLPMDCAARAPMATTPTRTPSRGADPSRMTSAASRCRVATPGGAAMSQGGTVARLEAGEKERAVPP
jgi:hypothetical protein